jgi:hypothetical protein
MREVNKNNRGNGVDKAKMDLWIADGKVTP